MSNDKKPKLELVPEGIELPLDERPWSMAETLDTEFPAEPPMPWYESEYDDVLRFDSDQYTDAEAIIKASEICQRLRWTPVGEVFTTARYHCLRVRKK